MPGLRPRWPGGARGRRWAGSVGRRLEWHGARSRCGPHPFGDLNCRVHLPPGLPPCDRIPRPPFVRPPLPNSRNRWRGPDLPMASVRKTASHWLRLRLSWRRGARGRRWGGHLRRRCGGRCPQRSTGLEPKWLLMMRMMTMMMMKLCLARDPRSRLEQSLTALMILSPGRVCHMQAHAGYGARLTRAPRNNMWHALG